jgi:hypothetical protein
MKHYYNDESKKLARRDIARRSRAATNAKAEYLELVVTKPGPERDAVMRAIDYMIKRMGFDTVITYQMPNWILGHMLAFARSEARRATLAKGRP